MRVFDPGTRFVNIHQSVQPNLARANRHAARLHGHTVAQGVIAFHARVAAHTFLAGMGCAAVHRLFVRALLHAFTIATTAALVDQYNAVFLPFVDRLARAGGGAGRVGTMVANTLEVEKPGLVHGQRSPLFTQAQTAAFIFGRRVFVKIGGAPLMVGRQIAQRLVTRLHFRGRLGDGHAVIDAVGGLFAGLVRVPLRGTSDRLMCLIQLLQNPYVPIFRIAAVWFAFHIVPPHVFLALGEGPGGFAGPGAGLAANAAIDVENGGKLLSWMGFFINIFHWSAKLPVINFCHDLLLRNDAPPGTCFIN